jgi:hypothetical protein
MVTLNGETFALDDFRGMGHARVRPAGFGRPAEPLFPDRIFAQMTTVIDENVDASGSAAASATTANAKAVIATAQASIATEQAAVATAAATSAEYPFLTTAGTGTAYTAVTSLAVADGFSARVNFTNASGNNPTLRVDSPTVTGTAYGLVDGARTDVNGAYVAIVAGRIPAGGNFVVFFDTRINKYVVYGLALLGAVSGIYQKSVTFSADQTLALNDAGTLQILTGTAQASAFIPLAATVNFDQDTEIDFRNESTMTLIIDAVSGVSFDGVDGGSLSLEPKEYGQAKKIGANSWIWRGSNSGGVV